jgi:uncharacterized protein (TIGR03067 family)
MRLRLLLPAVLLAGFGFAPAPFEKPERPGKYHPDLAKMQGDWVVLERRHGGGSDLPPSMRVRIVGRCFRVVIDDEVQSVWTIRLSPSAAPCQIDRKEIDTHTVMRGIYRFDGDRLTLCYVQYGERPAEFDAGTSNWLMVLARTSR